MDLSGKTIEELQRMDWHLATELGNWTLEDCPCRMCQENNQMLADRLEIQRRIEELQNQVTYADYVDDVQRSI
jgi:hypothetical protein